MKHTNQRYFYWLQDDDEEKDAENTKKVHNVLNNIKEDDKKPEDNDKPSDGPNMNTQS